MAVSAERLPLEIAFDAPPDVGDALAAIGRTEDVRLSPSRRRLALAGYGKDRIAVADVEIALSASAPEIAVTGITQLESPALRDPHGLDFVDDETLVVANRLGGLAVYSLPRAGSPGQLVPMGPADGARPPLVDGPGSVIVHATGSDGHEVFVCNNWANTVTRHALTAGGAIGGGEVVVRKWLDVPDGVAISHDGRWLAVSNHDLQCVFVYAYPAADEDAEPVGILRGVRYPHGLRFGAGDRYLLLADAGAPYVHVYLPADDGWHGVGYPALTIRVMDDETFLRGHHNPQEGGPKGIDVDPRTNVLIVTAECLPLAFFDVDAALERGEPGLGEDALVRYELFVLAERDRIKRARAAAHAQLDEVQRTKTWRLTEPARNAYGALRRLVRRRR